MSEDSKIKRDDQSIINPPYYLDLPVRLDECEILMERISGLAISLQESLDQANYRYRETGYYADRKWYGEAKTELRYIKRHRLMLQNHMATLRRNIRSDRAAKNFAAKEINLHRNALRHESAWAYDRALLDVIKENTSREQFMLWVQQAKDRIASKAPDS